MDKQMKYKGLRLKSVRQALKKTPDEMAEALLLKTSTYKNKEYGKNVITDSQLDELYRKFNINKDYILEGDPHPMFIKEDFIDLKSKDESYATDLILIMSELSQIEGTLDLLRKSVARIRNQITIKLKE